MNAKCTKLLILLLSFLLLILVFIFLPTTHALVVPQVLTSIFFTVLALVFAVLALIKQRRLFAWFSCFFAICGSMLTGLLFGLPITIVAILSMKNKKQPQIINKNK